MTTTSNSGAPRRAFLAGLAACAAVAVTAFATPLASAQDTVRIGLSGPFSGGSAPMGNSMRNGIRLAVHDINNFVGGVNGRLIELIEYDDEANNDKGREIAHKLIEEHKVVATIGVVNTGVAMNSIDLYQEARVPLMVAVSTGSPITRKYAPPNAPDNYIFRVSPPTTVSTAYLARHLVQLGLRRIALFADDTGYGEAEKTDFVAALASHGLEPVVIERFAIGDRDMKPQLERAIAAGADVAVMYGIGPELAAIARGRAELGWEVPLFGGWTVSMRNFLDAAGEAGNGVFTINTFIPGGENMRHKLFIESYEQQFGKDAMESAMSAAQGYDAMRLLYNGMALAEGFDGPAIRRALENLGGRGVEGVVTTYMNPFTAADHDAITDNMLVVGVVRDGRITYAFEEDARRSHAIRHKRIEPSTAR